MVGDLSNKANNNNNKKKPWRLRFKVSDISY